MIDNPYRPNINTTAGPRATVLPWLLIVLALAFATFMAIDMQKSKILIIKNAQGQWERIR